MADKEIYELEIEIENRDVDKTQKKLRSLDKLLQQTQRRAGLLGKTRIKPAVTLDDRFSSAARKIGDTLTRLHRTTVKPVVQLDDRASKAAVKLYATLAALSAPRWRVSVAGVDWETAVGDSFTKWISSDGKSTMQRISSSIASALGGGLKDVMMQALGLGDAVKASGAGNPAAAESPVDKPNLAANPAEGSKASTTSGADDKSGRILKAAGEFSNSVGLLLAKDFAKEWIQKGYKKITGKKDDPKNGKCTCICICKCGSGGRNSGGRNTGGGRGANAQGSRGRRVRGNSQTGTRSRVSFGNRTGRIGGSAGRKTFGKGAAAGLGLSMLMNTGIDLLTENGPSLLEGAKNLAGKGISSIKKGASRLGENGSKFINTGKNWIVEKGPKLMDKGKSLIGGKVPKLMDVGKSLIGGNGLSSLMKGAGWLGKGAKFIGKNLPGPLGLVGDAAAIATAGSKKNRFKATGSAVLSTAGGVVGGMIGSVIPGAGTVIGATLGSIAGDFLGNKVGGFLHDTFFSKKNKASLNTSKAMNTPAASLSQSASNQAMSPQTASIPDTNGLRTYRRFGNGRNEGVQKQSSTPFQINVSLSQGALNLTVNKDEINYDELAKAAGLRIANEVRFAMQNLK